MRFVHMYKRMYQTGGQTCARKGMTMTRSQTLNRDPCFTVKRQALRTATQEPLQTRIMCPTMEKDLQAH